MVKTIPTLHLPESVLGACLSIQAPDGAVELQMVLNALGDLFETAGRSKLRRRKKNWDDHEGKPLDDLGRTRKGKVTHGHLVPQTLPRRLS